MGKCVMCMLNVFLCVCDGVSVERGEEIRQFIMVNEP